MKKAFRIIISIPTIILWAVVFYVFADSTGIPQEEAMMLLLALSVYGAIALFGLLAKLIHMGTEKRFFGIVGAISDFIFTVFHGFLAFVAIVQEAGVDVWSVFVAITIIPLISFVLDVKAISEIDD